MWSSIIEFKSVYTRTNTKCISLCESRVWQLRESRVRQVYVRGVVREFSGTAIWPCDRVNNVNVNGQVNRGWLREFSGSRFLINQ